MGGKSKTQSESTVIQTTETTSTGLQDTEGFAVAGGGDVHIETTDQGAVQGAFDFTQQFGAGAFDFASDIAAQAAETSERAIETSQAALATVTTGGESDISKIDSKTIGLAVAGLVAIMVIPQIFKRAA